MAVLQKAKLLYSSHAVLKPVLWALIGAFALLMLLTFGYLSNQDSWNASARLVHIQQHFKAAWGVEDGLGGGSHQDEPTLKPWEEALYDRRVCSNTCPFARDGVCNDGRSGSGRVLCDVGTDCADCGAWSLKVPASLRTTPLGKPIEHLRERGVEVYIKDTKSDPTFRMPYTDDSKDIDVSKQMHVWGLVEMGLTQMWGRALQEGSPAACLQPGGSRSLVVDVGGNFGWYTLYAATLGCRVMVWEPVPHFRAFLEYGLQVNNLLGIVDLHATVVAPESDKQYEVLVPQQGIWGAAGIGGVNIDTNLGGGLQPEVVVVPGERLDAMVKEDVALMKIDIEGFEPDAFETAVRIFDQHTVRNVVIEYSPGVYEKGERWNDYHVWPDMLLRLHELGFTMLHVNWPSAKGDLLGVEPEKGWRQVALAPLPLITQAALQYDRGDAEALSRRSLNCPLPKELRARFPESWADCNRVPYDLHPKSFHSEFTYNTNVFATADPSLFTVGRQVGVHLPNQTEDEWFGRLGIAMGGFPCDSLPQETKVGARCPCTDLAVCGREAAIVESYARGGVWWKPWSRGSKLVG